MKKILYTLLIVPLLGFAQDENPCYSINDIFIQMDGENPSLEVNLVAGWNMIGYPCTQDMLLTDGFSSVDDKISMVKNNNGAVYIPEFNFNGIGFLESGQGYQVKMNEFVMGFSFCGSVQYPNLEGCTDCEASNFNQLANVDDGSCNYDSDGDGVIDSEEVVGCQDSLACDYNINATDSGECFYAQDGYDCDGNITAEIGDEIEGGYLFYLDETGARGMVAAMEDLEGVYAWGCYQTDINSDNSSLSPELDGIGTGLQNTLEIVSGCAEIPIAASEVLDFESNGFDDWYLPSKYEIIEMYDNIGQGANNIGNLSNSNYWSSSEENSISAFSMSFTNNTISNESKYNACYVRPIRAFGYTLGCMDSLACNFNSEANMSDGSCEYAELGYDCDGNFVEYVVGMEAEGGIVFYVDSTGERGLVAALEDLTEGASDNSETGLIGFEWGCYGKYVDGADGQTIGTGYQNTMDIVNQGCVVDYGGITAAQAALLFESEGYSDWYLPSIDELIEMYNTFGNLVSEVNIGGIDSGWYWSSSTFDNSSWGASFNDGAPYYGDWRNGPGNVRPIRAFGYTLGCMDETACNYNSEANMADGSCEYVECGYDCDGNITEYVVDESITEYFVGMEAEGGIIIYVDSTGQHGLVAAMEDLRNENDIYNRYNFGCDWGQSIGVGGIDEEEMCEVAYDSLGCTTDDDAGNVTGAQAVSDYVTECYYDDWYIPSLPELVLMHNIFVNIWYAEPDAPYMLSGNYMSSSEVAPYLSDSWYVYFNCFEDYWGGGGYDEDNCNCVTYSYKAAGARIRPIRLF